METAEETAVITEETVEPEKIQDAETEEIESAAVETIEETIPDAIISGTGIIPGDADLPAEDLTTEEETPAVSNLEMLASEFGLGEDEICAVLDKTAEEINAMPEEKLVYAKTVLEDAQEESDWGGLVYLFDKQ